MTTLSIQSTTTERTEMKIEKITLWTCTETYGKPKESGGLTALDYIIPALNEAQSQHLEFKLLDYGSEDYALVPFPTLEQVESVMDGMEWDEDKES